MIANCDLTATQISFFQLAVRESLVYFMVHCEIKIQAIAAHWE